MTHDLWAELNAHIYGFLAVVTLSELVRAASAPSGDRSWCTTIARRARARTDPVTA